MAVRENRFECSDETEIGVRAKPFWVFGHFRNGCSARAEIHKSIGCGYLFAILISAVNELPSPNFWDKYDQYNVVIGHILRFTNAAVVGFLISSFLNSFLIIKWKSKMDGKLFWLRSLLASSISEGAATFSAGLITFIGMMPTDNILHVMTNALFFKLGYGLIAVWPATFLVYILKKHEPGVRLYSSQRVVPQKGY